MSAVELMQAFHDEMVRREEAQFAGMAERYARATDGLRALFAALAYQLALKRDAGEAIHEATLWQLPSFMPFVAAMRDAVDGYMRHDADPTIAGGQRDFALLGLEHARACLLEEREEEEEGGAAFVPVLPPDVVDGWIGLLGNGAPLWSLLQNSYPDAVDRVIRALLEGTQRGDDPEVVLAAMMAATAVALDRALTIARTEQWRVYNEALGLMWGTSGQVRCMKRRAVLDERTCFACIIADGTILPLGAKLYDHPRGRCYLVPWVIGGKEPTWLYGLTWFLAQPPEKQRDILGGDYYDAWRDGEFELEDLYMIEHDEEWGDSVQVKPLRDLM